jgi:two-component system cell cycle sensor histidine kinase PleC
MKIRAKRKTSSLLSAYTADLGQLVSRRRAEMALRAAAIESAMASRAKSEFLANMSHELRTPLNAIIGFGDLIEHLAPEKRSAGKPREYASHISNAGKHLLEVINDILDISRIESGNFGLDLRLISLREVVETSVHLAQTRITQKGQMLDVQIPDNLPFVLADELRLRQILINLLSNASKFTDESGSLCVAASLDGPDAVAIAVADTGCGMSPEQIERALEPFTQVHSVHSIYSRQEEGTGLGLPIAKALIMRHGGKFFISSTPNVGTTVKFTLPAAV